MSYIDYGGEIVYVQGQNYFFRNDPQKVTV